MEKIWLVEFDCLDVNNLPVTLRFSSGPHIENSNFYEPRLKQPALFQNKLNSSIYTRSISSGNSFGEIVLINIDDDLAYLKDHAFDGREFRLRLKQGNNIRSILTGIVENITFSGKDVRFKIRDKVTSLDNNHPYNTYLGNNVLPNGLEGVETDLKGRIKPKCYGKVKQVPCVLVNTAKLIYQVHDGSGVEITEVYDRGVLITKHDHYIDIESFMTDDIPTGKYGTYLGYFKLGAQPSGTVTANVSSTNNSLGGVLNKLALEIGLSGAEAPEVGDVGMYIDTETTSFDIINELYSSCGLFWYVDLPENKLKYKTREIPSTVSLEFDDNAIIDVSLNYTGVGSNGLPFKKFKLKYDRVYVVQNDLAASVSAELKAKLAVDYREEVYDNTVTATRHLLSEELTLISYFSDKTVASSVVNSIGEKITNKLESVTITLRLEEELDFNQYLGSAVKITSRRLGYNNSKVFQLVGFNIDSRLNKVQLFLLG